jgi:hypothetical protein
MSHPEVVLFGVKLPKNAKPWKWLPSGAGPGSARVCAR